MWHLLMAAWSGMSLTDTAVRNSYFKKGQRNAQNQIIWVRPSPEKTKTPAARIRRSGVALADHQITLRDQRWSAVR